MIHYNVLTDALLARLEPFGFCHVDGVPTSEDDAACQAIIDQYEETDAKAALVSSYEVAVQARLDQEAQAKGYDNIVSACSYAAAPNPFQAESSSFVAWRGQVWAYCYNLLTQVDSGTAAAPTIDDLIAGLPARQ